jgi:hypothetical protein
MGGKVSTLPGGTITRESLLRSTEPMRLLMNDALRIMNEQFTPHDLRKLGSSQECSKYIILIGNAFDKYFKSIEVVPVMKSSEKGKRTIYFQRADVLTGTTTSGSKLLDEQLKADREQVCKTIGYFFTRLYQIIAALSFSLFDNASIRPGAVVTAQPNIYGILPQAGPLGRQLGGPWAARGGGLLATTPFRLFDPWVSPRRDDERIYEFDDIRSGVTGFLYLTDLHEVSTLKGEFQFKYIRSQLSRQNRITVAAVITTIGTTQFRITLTDIRIYYDGRDYNIPIQQSYDFKVLIFNKTERGTYTTPKYVAKDKKYEKLPTILAALFDHLWTHKTSLINGRAIPAFWSIDTRVAIPTQNILGPRAQVQQAQQLFAKDVQPIAHCVARSLQLLSLDITGPLGGKKAWSFVCEPRFSVTGLPSRGKTLTDIEGIKQLDMLYTIFSKGAMVHMTREYGEYMESLKKMSAAFEGTDKQVAAATLGQIKFGEKEGVACKGRSGAIEVSGDTLSIAQDGVQLLWKKQIQHAIGVNKIMSQLFSKDKVGQLIIHPQLLEIGVVGLDIIAASARQLLSDYYSECENIYQSAVAKITSPQ